MVASMSREEADGCSEGGACFGLNRNTWEKFKLLIVRKNSGKKIGW